MKVVLFVCFFLALVQSISSFCVYNNITDYVTIIAKQIMVNTDPFKTFSATLDPGQKQCCHYSNFDCTHEGRNSETASFEIDFYRRSNTLRSKYIVDCTTGGGLVIYNIHEKYAATCTYANGKTIDVAMDFVG